MTVGLGKGGRSVSWSFPLLEVGRKLATRDGSGGGPIGPVDGRLGGRSMSLFGDDERDERWKGSSRLGGRMFSAVDGRSAHVELLF